MRASKRRDIIALAVIIATVMVIAVGITLVCTLNKSDTDKRELIGKVTLTIECRTILDNMDDLKEEYQEFLPADGYILREKEVDIYSKDSVLDVLKRVCAEDHIRLSETGGYVSSIGNIAEGCCGSGSGWLYHVDGEIPLSVPAGKYKVRDGMKVVFAFTCVNGDVQEGLLDGGLHE